MTTIDNGNCGRETSGELEIEEGGDVPMVEIGGGHVGFRIFGELNWN